MVQFLSSMRSAVHFFRLLGLCCLALALLGAVPERGTEVPGSREPVVTKPPRPKIRQGYPPAGSLKVVNVVRVDWRNDRGTRERNAGRLIGPVPSRYDAGTVATGGPSVCPPPNCSFDIECDDGNKCTADECNISPGTGVCTGTCVHTPVADGDAGDCDDGLFCNGESTCSNLVCSPASGNPGAPCDENSDCTGPNGQCYGTCQAGTPAQCCNDPPDNVTFCHEVGRCVGSSNPGASCTADADCPGGTCDRCQPACDQVGADPDCNDGVNCNGVEQCADVDPGAPVVLRCIPGQNPCGSNATCFEGECSEANPKPCNSNAECAGTCVTSPLGNNIPFCLSGRCCLPFSDDNGETQPTCSHRTLTDCATLNTNSQWYPGDGGSLLAADQVLKCGGSDERIFATDAWGCPKYGRGITMHSATTQPTYPVTVGPVSHSPAAVVAPNGPNGALYQLGDDYSFTNTGANDFMGLDVLRWAGGTLDAAYLSIDFYDQNGTFVEDVISGPLSPGIGVQVVVFSPSLTIPPSGYVTMRVAADVSPNGRFVWLSTTNINGVQGVNDSNRLWVNKGPTNASFLGQPQILAMELVGDKEPDPIGACCDKSTGECVDGVLSWICKQNPNNAFNGVGTRCATCNAGPQAGQNCRRCVGGSRHGLACDCDTGCTLDCPSGSCDPSAPVCTGMGCTAGNVGGGCTMDDDCDILGDCNGVQCTAGNIGQACTMVGPDPVCDVQGACGPASCVAQCAVGACCNPTTGACTEDSEFSCASGGGDFAGFGTSCDADPPGPGGDTAAQHCCEQPVEQRCMGGHNNDAACSVAEQGVCGVVCTAGMTGFPCMVDDDCDLGNHAQCARCIGRCSDDPERQCTGAGDCPAGFCLGAKVGQTCGQATQQAADAFCKDNADPNGTACIDNICVDGIRAGLACQFVVECQVSVCDGRCVRRWSGADDCADARVHDVTVPLQTDNPPYKVITITGDNEGATSYFAHPDSCFSPSLDANADPGHWEAFTINECANVRIDFCCSDPVRQPAYTSLYRNCACTELVEPQPNPNTADPAVGQGAPWCTDDNAWMTFPLLPAGTYHYPVLAALAGAHGQYQMHITVEPCPKAACCYLECTGGLRNGLSCDRSCPGGSCDGAGICVGGSVDGASCDCPSGSCDSKCGELTQRECDAKAGFSLQPPQVQGFNVTPICTPGLCDHGSCCTQADTCSDAREAGGGSPGTPMTPALCDGPGFFGTFIGGAQCRGGVCADPPDAGLSCSVASDCEGNTTCIGTPLERSQPSPCAGCTCPRPEGTPRMDVPAVTVTNRTGSPAGDLHITFADTGGSLNALAPLVYAPGCSGVSVIVPGGSSTIIILWNEECVLPGGSVSFIPGTNNGPLEFCCGYWSNAAGRRIGAVAPGDIAFRRELDVSVKALGRHRAGAGGGEVPPAQVPDAVDAEGNRVAFSFGFLLENPDPDGVGAKQAAPIPWAWPVREAANTPWVVVNGYSGGTEGINEPHDRILDAAAMHGANYYGPHPHCQLYVFKQPGGGGPLELIGCSDLKHHFATVHDADMAPHFMVNGEDDTYGKFPIGPGGIDSNADRNFFGPVADMDADFKVVQHEHLGARVLVGGKPLVERGFAVYERDHGEPQHMAPPADLFGHRLQAAIHNMLTVNQLGPDGMFGNQPPGTKWYFAATVFVHDPSVNGAKGGKEKNRTNNTVFREFDPGWNGANFVPAWVGDSKRLKDDGAFSNFVAVTEPGLFYGPAYHPHCVAPKKQTDCGNGVIDIGEDCDFLNDTACPGLCGQPGGDPSDDCKCPSAVCGNGVLDIHEECEFDSDCLSGSCRVAGDPLRECTCACGTAVPPPVLTWNSAVEQGRSITFTAENPAVATGADGTSAIKVTLVDLENPVPPNNNPVGPCCPPGNFTTFDTASNSVCAGGNDQGYRCPPSACPGSSCPPGVGCSEAAGVCPGVTCGQGGCARWVGPPLGYLESNDNPGLGNYRVSRLQCTPFYYDWVPEPNGGLVNIIGADIVPSSTYQLQAFGADCKGSESNCGNVSPPVVVTTRRAGDIATPFQGGPPLTQPNAIDVTNAVNKFRNLAGSPPKVVSQVQPNFPDPNADINAIDIVTVVDNQRGFGYTYSGPCICPSTVPCNTTACAGASACTGLYGAGATCIKTCTSGRTGQPCNNNLNCGFCVGGPATGAGAAGIPCDANGDCASGTCQTGVCPTGATPGFCRDRCGRCD